MIKNLIFKIVYLIFIAIIFVSEGSENNMIVFNQYIFSIGRSEVNNRVFLNNLFSVGRGQILGNNLVSVNRSSILELVKSYEKEESGIFEIIIIDHIPAGLGNLVFNVTTYTYNEEIFKETSQYLVKTYLENDLNDIGHVVYSTQKQIKTDRSSVRIDRNHNIVGAVGWSRAQELFPRGKDATIKDVFTGESFRVRRTFGSNHADVEPLSIYDTKIIYNLWGGHSWEQRSILVITDTGYVMAASMNGYPHAGLDAYPALAIVHNRSGGFGTGQNLDTIKGNGVNGHFCIHFLYSTTHGTRRIHGGHQNMVAVASRWLDEIWHY